jgi:hypothetical protein
MSDNTKSYNKCDDLCKMEHLWIPTKGKGKKDCAWVHITDIPFFKQLRAEMNLLMGDRKALGLMTQAELTKTDIRNSPSFIGNTHNIIENSELIIDGIPTTNLQVVGEYVQQFMLVNKIYRGELTEEEERYCKVGALKFINGELIKDEDKYNKAMMAVL